MAVTVKEKQAIRGLEAVAERPDGTRVPFLPFPTPIFNTSGVFVGAVNMLIDITERKRAEEATLLLASIVDTSDDAIVTKDLDGIITSWNKGAELIFGYMAEEIVGKSIKVLIPPEYHDEENTILDSIRRGERIQHYEAIRRRKNGSLINISLSVSPLRNGQGKIIGASKIARDITERARASEQIKLLAREAEHRTRNILATVQATIHLTQAEDAAEFKKAIGGRIRALSNVNNLFVETRWQGAELRTLVAQELEPYRRGDGTRINIDGPALLLEPTIAQTMAVVLHELATNAAKYGPLSLDGGGKVAVTWTSGEDGRLGRVDKPEPDANGRQQHEGCKALDQLVVSGGDAT
jgi:PAS domain S-box-containing protein